MAKSQTGVALRCPLENSCDLGGARNKAYFWLKAKKQAKVALIAMSSSHDTVLGKQKISFSQSEKSVSNYFRTDMSHKTIGHFQLSNCLFGFLKTISLLTLK